MATTGEPVLPLLWEEHPRQGEEDTDKYMASPSTGKHALTEVNAPPTAGAVESTLRTH